MTNSGFLHWLMRCCLSKPKIIRNWNKNLSVVHVYLEGAGAGYRDHYYLMSRSRSSRTTVQEARRRSWRRQVVTSRGPVGRSQGGRHLSWDQSGPWRQAGSDGRPALGLLLLPPFLLHLPPFLLLLPPILILFSPALILFSPNVLLAPSWLSHPLTPDPWFLVHRQIDQRWHIGLLEVR